MPDSRNWFEILPVQRQRRFLASRREGVQIEVNGQWLVNFASNDYLGLSVHSEINAAVTDSVASHGWGSGASRLISGDDPELHGLEKELAEWKGYEACLIVGSGMLANMGLLQALADRHARLFTDKLNHASLVDGARLSGAKVHRYAHLDMAQLEMLLEKHPAERRVIVSDGVFSMDGDAADVSRLQALAAEYDAILVIDDAHGIGTLGPDGRGLTANLAGDTRLIEVGTFGKAFGSYGAFILGTRELIEGLRQRLRTMIYSTALPAAAPVAARVALQLIRQGELTRRLQANVVLFKAEAKGLPLMASETAIQPLMIGSDADALAAAEGLREAGFFVPAVRPPTVPEGSARLRITLSAAHTPEQIRNLVSALRQVLK